MRNITQIKNKNSIAQTTGRMDHVRTSTLRSVPTLGRSPFRFLAASAEKSPFAPTTTASRSPRRSGRARHRFWTSRKNEFTLSATNSAREERRGDGGAMTRPRVLALAARGTNPRPPGKNRWMRFSCMGNTEACGSTGTERWIYPRRR